MKKAAPLAILLAALLWGTMGIVTRYVVSLGFNTLEATAIRITVSALFFFVLLVFTNRDKLKINPRDLKWFLLTGVGSLFVNNLSYAATVQMANLSVAVVLLNTAPFFVLIMSVLFFKEKLTPIKVTALLFSFLGCILVVGLSSQSLKAGHSLKSVLVVGLIAGFSYSLYTVFGKILLKKYHFLTVTAYTFFIAAIVAILFAGPWHLLKEGAQKGTLIIPALLGSIISIAFPYLSYSWALKYVEAGSAPIIASFEVVAASIYGVVLHGETLSAINILGIFLVLIAIALLQKKPRENKEDTIDETL